MRRAAWLLCSTDSVAHEWLSKRGLTVTSKGPFINSQLTEINVSINET